MMRYTLRAVIVALAIAGPLKAQVPLISALTPASVTSGSPAFDLTVTGANFTPQSMVHWNGAARTTVFVAASQVRAQIPASDVSSPGSFAVTVVNAGGTTSNAVTFVVRAPAPVITALSPPGVQAGTAGITLTVYGSSFSSGAVVRWDGVPRTTTFVAETQLQAAIQTGDLSKAGDIGVTVRNQDGATSAPATFKVLPVSDVHSAPGSSGIPRAFVLEQNYPNPFNPATTIRYGLPVKSAVRLVVFDLRGRMAEILVNQEQEPGYHEVGFGGHALASGVYVCCLEAGSVVLSRKILLVR